MTKTQREIDMEHFIEAMVNGVSFQKVYFKDGEIKRENLDYNETIERLKKEDTPK